MQSFEELQDWLQKNYPDIRVHRFKSGAWCLEQLEEFVETMELDPSYEYDGFAYKVAGYRTIFEVKNRLPGGWVCDEIIKRDPRYSSRPGNHYHDAYLLSLEAEKEHEKMTEDTRNSAAASWDIVKRTPALMDRISDHLARGDTDAACKEVSPEALFKNALKENPKELRTKDFWRSI